MQFKLDVATITGKHSDDTLFTCAGLLYSPGDLMRSGDEFAIDM
jgi:hypothetical protein